MLEIDITDEQLKQLAQAAAALDDTTSLMDKIAGDLRYETDRNFELEGRPKWQGLKYRQGKPLQLSGQLAASIQRMHSKDEAVIGSNKVYAAIQQEGGKTRPHIIRPRYKKALKFNGRFAKVVHHPGSDIPARPFLPVLKNGELQPEALDAVMHTTNTYLRKVLG